jgi:hypothetical protein
MNIGQICSVTFSDAAGAFFVGLAMGAAILLLLQAAAKGRKS